MTTQQRDGGGDPKPASRPSLFDYQRAEETGEFAVSRNVMVAMADGVRLATDVYLPARDGRPLPGPFPVLLDRTPYEKGYRAGPANDPPYFARRGYAFVFQDSRGHGASEGEFRLYLDEGRDGLDTVRWIRAQPWCDGTVATSGSSYDAAVQYALAREAPAGEGPAAMFPAFATSSYRNDGGGHGGAFRLAHNFVYTLHHAVRDRRARDNPGVDALLHEALDNAWDWMARPMSRHLRLLRDVPQAQAWYRDWLDHPGLDGYWTQNGFHFEDSYAETARIPVVHLSGYYDFFLLGTLRNFAGMRDAARAPQHLVLGPWCHGPMNMRRTWQGEVDFGPASAVDWNGLRLAFFDMTMQRRDSGLFPDSGAVHAFIMGGGSGRREPGGRLDHGGHWVSGTGWPLPGSRALSLFLCGDGGLSRDRGPAGDGESAFVYDPADPCPQIGGDYTYPRGLTDELRRHSGPRNQVGRREIPLCRDTLPLAARPDVLVFETEPLEEDVEMLGPMRAELFVSTSAPDTDFTARLIDQYPPSTDWPGGFAMLIRESVVRLRYRNGLHRAEFAEPGTVVAATIDLWAAGNLFRKGHRIRLDISSSSFPNFDPNPNTGEPIGRHTHTRVARNAVHHGPSHPSRLVLTLTPPRGR